MSRGDTHIHRMLRTGEWSKSELNDRIIEESLNLWQFPLEEGDAGFTSGVEQELMIVEAVRRKVERHTPRYFSAVCARVDQVSEAMVETLRNSLQELATQHLGATAQVIPTPEDGDEGVAFRVDYDAPEEITDELLDSLAAVRKGFVSVVPEDYWGKVALFTRAR